MPSLSYGSLGKHIFLSKRSQRFHQNLESPLASAQCWAAKEEMPVRRHRWGPPLLCGAPDSPAYFSVGQIVLHFPHKRNSRKPGPGDRSVRRPPTGDPSSGAASSSSRIQDNESGVDYTRDPVLCFTQHNRGGRTVHPSQQLEPFVDRCALSRASGELNAYKWDEDRGPPCVCYRNPTS